MRISFAWSQWSLHFQLHFELWISSCGWGRDEGRVLLNHDSWLLFLGCQLQCYINAKIQDWIIDEECTHSAWKGRSTGSAGDMRMDTSLATWNCLQAGAAVCDALVSLTKNAQLDSISSWRSSVSNAEVVTDVISFGLGGCLSQGHWPHHYPGNLFPRYAGLITAALVGTFDASSAVFVALACLGLGTQSH